MLCDTGEYDGNGLNLMAYEGETVILKCPTTTSEGNVYLWTRNGKEYFLLLFSHEIL